MSTKQKILTALSAWINQRPGLRFADYGDASAYRAEQRAINKDKRDALTLLSAVALNDSITADSIIDASKHAFSGRLEIIPDGDSIQLDYTTGQYWPTEYRRAACAVLASALWHAMRRTMPETDDAPGLTMRAAFRKQFGRRMQSRWFD